MVLLGSWVGVVQAVGTHLHRPCRRQNVCFCLFQRASQLIQAAAGNNTRYAAGQPHYCISYMQRHKNQRILAPAPHINHHTQQYSPFHTHRIIAFETELAMLWPCEPRANAGRRMPDEKYLHAESRITVRL